MAEYYLMLGFASGSILVIVSGLYAYVAFRDRPAPGADATETVSSARVSSL